VAKYVCALIAVSDIGRSRAFYEGLLAQKVKADFGPNVTYEGSFAIHERTHFQSLLGEGSTGLPPVGGDRATGDELRPTFVGELYFEEDALEEAERKLRDAGVSFVHPTREQPWAQRVLRCLDPDGHIVEVGETMEAVVRRLVREGMSAAQAGQKTGMGVDFVEFALAGER
jgi:catechol 2,3-dioxygenase-like lactoylglutathione lyase family enzyme